ncbi:MAG TPA: chitin binding peritrophin-A domain-containing protein [Streptosporangiaceae bacterium]|nr:chitin binding peritrophin-A domain-containing protein [Streptosporangiaceae bacterium]
MRALRRHLLATLFIAAAILSAGTPAKAITNASAHISGVVAAFHSPKAVRMICPAGTNWDNNLQKCD